MVLTIWILYPSLVVRVELPGLASNSKQQAFTKWAKFKALSWYFGMGHNFCGW